MQGIHRQLTSARRRLAAQGALTGAVVATPIAAALGLVAGATPAIGVIAAAAALGAARRRDPEAIARRLDRHAHLSDRLGNAVAFTRDGPTAGLAALAIADGERHAHLADPRAAIPLRAPRATAYAFAGVAVVAAIALVPIPSATLPAVPRITLPGTHPAPAPDLSDADLGFLHRLIASRRSATRDPAYHLLLDDLDASLASSDRTDLLKQLAALADTFPDLTDITTAIRHSRPPGSPVSSLPPTLEPPNVRTSEPQGKRATVESAARHGFAGVSYRSVYADYADIVEDVMRTERVPPGHRYLVERYFDTIRPQEPQESEIQGRPGASNGNGIIDVPDVTPPGHR